MQNIEEAKKEIPLTFNNNFFGPRTENCLTFTRKEINVIFIDSCLNLINNFNKYFKNTEFIGIDTEWKESIKIKIKTTTALMQLSDYEAKNIFLLDMIKLNKDIQFNQIFENLFTNKNFIGFSFNDDLVNMTNQMKVFFTEKIKLIDIKNVYSNKLEKQCPNLSKVCEEILGKPLCKYEQCSNWENRPLRECQCHYAALDAIVCCLIYKKLMNE